VQIAVLQEKLRHVEADASGTRMIHMLEAHSQTIMSPKSFPTNSPLHPFVYSPKPHSRSGSRPRLTMPLPSLVEGVSHFDDYNRAYNRHDYMFCSAMFSR